MKILVIEDSAINQEAARQTLSGHELTIAESYDEAMKLLLRKRSFDNKAPKDTQPHPFDVVLTDLMMEPSDKGLSDCGHENNKGQMPVGFPLALAAALSGAKYVGCVTQTNHHDHPMSHSIDDLDGYGHNDYWRDDSPRSRAHFNINGAIVGFFHHPEYLVEGSICESCKGEKQTEQTCRTCSYNQLGGKSCEVCHDTHKTMYRCHPCKGTGHRKGKHWGKVLDRLLEER
jgi:CheY-like chemotaxis protein